MAAWTPLVTATIVTYLLAVMDCCTRVEYIQWTKIFDSLPTGVPQHIPLEKCARQRRASLLVMTNSE
uniref:Secreted protein n=1 Tax=Arundo donax TaxID=35708 RepID=A0A0A9I3G7_ARUDO